MLKNKENIRMYAPNPSKSIHESTRFVGDQAYTDWYSTGKFVESYANEEYYKEHCKRVS